MNPENNKDVNKDVNYEPLNGSKLDELLKNSKGIESLWKKIKDNKDGKKSYLYKYENDLTEIVKDFIDGFTEIKQKFEKEGLVLDLGKSLASKEQYEIMLQTVLKDSKKVTAFKTKFPHWTIQVGRLFADSTHFKRISTGVSGAKEKTENITDNSTFDVQKKGGEKKTGRESKSEKTNKGILKQINLFWNRYFKRGGLGKASKSKVTIELKKFGDYVNKPWRKWWELVADKDDKLSSSVPKSRLKMALNLKNGQNKVAVLNLYNAGKNTDSNKLEAQHSESILFDPNNIRSLDQKQNNFNKMFDVFSSLDKSLGNKVRRLFDVEPIKEKSFLDKFKKKPDGKKTDNQTATSSLGGSTNLESSNLGSSSSNINITNESFSSSQSPQAGGSNLTFDQDRVDEIISIFKQIGIPESGAMEKFYKENKDLVKAKKALNAIIKLNNEIKYTPGDKTRPKFLVSVANYLGLKSFAEKGDKSKGIIAIQDICHGEITDLSKDYQKNNAILAVQRVRNLIRYGMNIGKNDKLPALA